MFKKTRTKIRETIDSIKATVKSLFFVIAVLTRTLEDNSSSLDALKTEQRELRAKLDQLVEHSRFLAHAKRSELTRSGHRTDF